MSAGNDAELVRLLDTSKPREVLVRATRARIVEIGTIRRRPASRLIDEIQRLSEFGSARPIWTSCAATRPCVPQYALQNGDEIFPAMLAAITEAKSSITFETCIHWSGDMGRAFADALRERAQDGVSVHVMLDWAGSAKMDQRLLGELTEAGVQVERYHELNWYSLGRLNNRTHRNLLVVDD